MSLVKMVDREIAQIERQVKDIEEDIIRLHERVELLKNNLCDLRKTIQELLEKK